MNPLQIIFFIIHHLWRKKLVTIEIQTSPSSFKLKEVIRRNCNIELKKLKNNLKYFIDFSITNNIYIFANNSTVKEIDDICKRIKINYIYRDENQDLYKSLTLFEKESYDYWRSHLCIVLYIVWKN